MPLDKSAIETIQQAHASEILNESARKVMDQVPTHPGEKPLIVAPDNFIISDLEDYLPGRCRYRGLMTTHLIQDFAAYVRRFSKSEDDICFVDPDDMSGMAYFNLGSLSNPGHADFRARIELKKTSAYEVLLKATNERFLSQRDMAEWFEDHRQKITFIDGQGGAIGAVPAIGSVRRMTIDRARSSTSEEQSFSANRSSMESVEAKAEATPHFIRYACVPFHGLKEYDILCRVGMLTGGDDPKFTLKVVDPESYTEQFSDEFVAKLEDALVGEDITFIRGRFKP